MINENIDYVLGDFNCYENGLYDHSGRKNIKHPEFINLKETLNLLGLFEAKISEKSKSRFTHYDKTHNVLTRIDHIFINSRMKPQTTKITIDINTISDHRSLIFGIIDQIETKRTQPHLINSEIFEEETSYLMIEHLINTWKNKIITSTKPQVDYIIFKERLKTLLTQESYYLKKSNIKKTAIIIKRLKNLENKKILDGNDMATIKLLNEQICEISKVENKSQQKIFSEKMEEEWENPTKFFFKSHKISTHNAIIALQDNDNGICVDPKKIHEIATKFYVDLIGKGKNSDNDGFFDGCFLENKFSENVEIQKEDILNSIKRINIYKANGPDKIAGKLYKIFSIAMAEILAVVFKNIASTGYMEKELSKSVIMLLHKSDDKTLISNYRPISLLNHDYKILTRLIDEKYINILKPLLSRNQYGFMENNFIFNPIIRVMNTIEFGNIGETNGNLASLDIKKAYDSVGWGWIDYCLTKMRLPVLAKWIKTLYQCFSSW